MTKGLSLAGHDVFVIATAPEETKADNVYFLRSNFYNLGNYPIWYRFFWHLFDFFAWGKLKKITNILDRERPDLVITHNLVGVGLSLPRFLKKKKYRHFHVLHDIQLLHPSGLMFWNKEKLINSWPARFYQFAVKLLFASPEVVISPSGWLLAEHKKKGFFPASEKKVIPHFFPSKFLNSKLGNCSWEKDKKNSGSRRFLFVGQLEEYKGAEFLVDTWRFVCENNPSWQGELLMAGAGALSGKLEAAAALSLPSLKLLGRRTSDEIFELMKTADCLIVPSLCYENSPTVIYEAAAARLPIAAADLGGISELIRAVGGCLFEPGNQKDLAEKILRFPTDCAPLPLDFKADDYFVSLEKLIKS
jgi:glycosyltransferase involved in cell wall biosynthesis